MPQVPLTINGRIYRLGCAAGDEARLKEVGRILAQKMDALVAEFGQAGESRLLLMAGLLVADELLDTRAALDATLTEQTDALKRVAAEAAPAASEALAKSADKQKPQKPRIDLPGKAGAPG